MSKLKNLPENITPHIKKKLIHNMRRKDDVRVKEKRKMGAKTYGYGYRYYIMDHKYIRESYEVTYPARYEPTWHLEHTVKNYIDKEGNAQRIDDYKKVYDGDQYIPARTVRRSHIVGVEFLEKPYLKQISKQKIKKYFKKYAQKKVRHFRPDDAVSGSGYRKIYDIWWNID